MSASFSISPTVHFSRSNLPIASPPNTKILCFAPTIKSQTPPNFYEVLGVKETASPIEIKTAYRTLAKQFHPDKGSDGRDFMEIRGAYATLSDPAAREEYDRSRGRQHRIRFISLSRSGTVFRTRRWETDQCW